MIMVTNNDAVQLLRNAKSNSIRQEKPRHLKYLNEFRTQQCLLFLEQQCQFHRPYTCFHWHFPNQKRRRPHKRIDGTFNYNPDVYCDKYDETSGSCVDGDFCPYAHRNAGDTERRYHPRYFKTGNCIYETTESGACVKNGLHCAFAHGPDDIRLPVYDIREVQDTSSKFTVNLPASLEKERVLSEDPKWNEMFHVLACYKTELCKKPPRMCRQGYSCPFYHNGKDKRRAPDRSHYRSTPCPAVRPGDEWQDSGLCEAGDACVCCHTRTEQQFHPEVSICWLIG
ncbi:RING finger protein unkempt [Paragonimus kellicotti]|nr:RING finger protein unkempt [Paragonimus kellicotti]